MLYIFSFSVEYINKLKTPLAQYAQCNENTLIKCSKTCYRFRKEILDRYPFSANKPSFNPAIYSYILDDEIIIFLLHYYNL